MARKNKPLSILSEAEQEALYGIPDFDDMQRLEFLALDESELALANSWKGLHAQLCCILQIAYFKAKSLFFRFEWNDVRDDCNFILSRYFPGESLRNNRPLNMNVIFNEKKSANCIIIVRGHQHYLRWLSSKLSILSTAISLLGLLPLN